jgi:hypothetical protein
LEENCPWFSGFRKGDEVTDFSRPEVRKPQKGAIIRFDEKGFNKPDANKEPTDSMYVFQIPSKQGTRRANLLNRACERASGISLPHNQRSSNTSSRQNMLFPFLLHRRVTSSMAPAEE